MRSEMCEDKDENDGHYEESQKCRVLATYAQWNVRGQKGK